MASSDLRERTVMCSESIEAFKVLSPDLLKELSVASKAQIQMFFKVITKLITSAEESPGGKFYSLYLLLKASETSPTQDFLIELASSQELLHFIFWTASNDMGKGLDHSQRGKNYFLKNPTQNEANMGVNFVRLCLETGMFWGKYFGKKDPSDPRNTLWKRLENIAKRGELPSTYLFVGKEYPGRTEIASWNFAKGDLPSIPYKPTDLNDVRNKSASEIQEEKEKSLALINVKRVTYEEDLLKEKAESRPNFESRPNLDRILKSEPSDPSSPNAEEKFSPDLVKKSSQAGSKVNVDVGAQRSKPSSRVLEENASRSRSANILEDKPDLMKKVNNDLDSSLNSSYASKKDYQGYEGRSPSKKLTFASRMTEMGVFNERTPTPERRKSPAPTQIQNNYQARTTADRSSPQKRDGSPMTGDLKSSTENIRNFFNERDKPQLPKGVSARAWESNQTSPTKMVNPEITPQFIQTQSGRVSKSPDLEPKGRGFETGPNIKDSGENLPVGRKGPVSRAGVPVQMSESSRVIPSNPNVDEAQSTEVKILSKQIESFRNENIFLMNEIQRYQEEFKRRMELEKLLIKENNHLKSTISNSSQQVQDMSLAMTDLYDKNQKLTRELLEAKKELEYYKGSRK